MIIPKEFLKRCDSKYKKMLKKLEKKVAAIVADNNDETSGYFNVGEEDDTEKQFRDIVIKYGKKYILPKEYWDYCMDVISDYAFSFSNPTYSNTYYQLASEAASHFYFNKRKEKMSRRENKRFLKFFNKTDVKLGSYKVTEKDFSYPHSHLHACFEYYESHSCTIPSNEISAKYTEMKKLYSKIKASEKDVEKWLNFLVQTNDHKFIKDNVELRIGKNLLDKLLWKYYINYLKENGFIEEMLQIFSRYIRFFTDDAKMKKEYKIELEKYGKPIGLKWKNLFDFEIKFAKNDENNENEAIEDCQDKVKDVDIGNGVEMEKPFDQNLCKNVFNNVFVQNFHFQQTFISYILENAVPTILQKLHHSCKCFYTKNMTPFCYLFKATSGLTNFKNESLSLNYKEKREKFLKNTFIFGSIIAKTDGFHFIPPNFISSCIPHFYQCIPKYIDLDRQNLTFNELVFLVGSGKVVQLKMERGKIIDENQKFVDLENILALLPNIETLSLPSVNVNKNTLKAISNLKFFQKLFSFSIDRIHGEPFDPSEFFEFCVEHRDPDEFSATIGFHHSFNVEFVEKFAGIMSDYESQYEKECKMCIRVFAHFLEP